MSTQQVHGKPTMLLTNLERSTKGASWLSILPQQCIEALEYVGNMLAESWADDSCVPTERDVLQPFHMIAPDEVRLVIICKEPYSSLYMATGIPVEVKSNNIPTTPSEQAFIELIGAYWNNTSRESFMKCYYASGILVINASFTTTPLLDKRYSLAASHFPLWSRFTHPLVRFFNSYSIPILALGVEARGLLRNLPNATTAYYCTFPRDGESRRLFVSTAKELIVKYVHKPSLP